MVFSLIAPAIAGIGKVAAAAKTVQDVGLGGKLLPQSVQDFVAPKVRTEQGQATAISVPSEQTQATETAFSGEVSAVQPVQAYSSFLPQIIQRAPQMGRAARDIAVGVGAVAR